MHSTSARRYEWQGFSRRSISPLSGGENSLKLVGDGPLHWEMAVTDFLVTFENWLPSVHFNNAEWIPQQWVEMLLRKCRSESREAKKKGKGGNKRLATNLGEHGCNKA